MSSFCFYELQNITADLAKKQVMSQSLQICFAGIQSNLNDPQYYHFALVNVITQKALAFCSVLVKNTVYHIYNVCSTRTEKDTCFKLLCSMVDFIRSSSGIFFPTILLDVKEHLTKAQQCYQRVGFVRHSYQNDTLGWLMIYNPYVSCASFCNDYFYLNVHVDQTAMLDVLYNSLISFLTNMGIADPPSFVASLLHTIRLCNSMGKWELSQIARRARDYHNLSHFYSSMKQQSLMYSVLNMWNMLVCDDNPFLYEKIRSRSYGSTLDQYNDIRDICSKYNFPHLPYAESLDDTVCFSWANECKSKVSMVGFTIAGKTFQRISGPISCSYFTPDFTMPINVENNIPSFLLLGDWHQGGATCVQKADTLFLVDNKMSRSNKTQHFLSLLNSISSVEYPISFYLESNFGFRYFAQNSYFQARENTNAFDTWLTQERAKVRHSDMEKMLKIEENNLTCFMPEHYDDQTIKQENQCQFEGLLWNYADLRGYKRSHKYLFEIMAGDIFRASSLPHTGASALGWPIAEQNWKLIYDNSGNKQEMVAFFQEMCKLYMVLLLGTSNTMLEKVQTPPLQPLQMKFTIDNTYSYIFNVDTKDLKALSQDFPIPPLKSRLLSFTNAIFSSDLIKRHSKLWKQYGDTKLVLSDQTLQEVFYELLLLYVEFGDKEKRIGKVDLTEDSSRNVHYAMMLHFLLQRTFHKVQGFVVKDSDEVYAFWERSSLQFFPNSFLLPCMAPLLDAYFLFRSFTETDASDRFKESKLPWCSVLYAGDAHCYVIQRYLENCVDNQKKPYFSSVILETGRPTKDGCVDMQGQSINVDKAGAFTETISSIVAK